MSNEKQVDAFALGASVWPGMAKVVEELGELQQVLGKLMMLGGGTQHWQGDLRPALVEEIADVLAAVTVFRDLNLTSAELIAASDRIREKHALFLKWHTNPED